MVACPYHARSFNWWTPEWPEGMEATLNPDVSMRTRGVVEKCNFCSSGSRPRGRRPRPPGRREIDPADYVPACVEACPSQAIVFGDLDDAKSEVARLAKARESFRLLARLGTGPEGPLPFARTRSARRAPARRTRR